MSVNIESIYEKANRRVSTQDLYSHLKILGLMADKSACGNYRVANPLKYLSKYGAQVKMVHTCSPMDLVNSDIIIAQRQYDKDVANNIIYEAKRHGKLVIYEVDDNLHAVLPSSPVFGIYHTGSQELNMVSKLLTGCHGLTVSTVELAGNYAGCNPNIEVLPNAIDYELRDWETVPEKDPNTVVVGWSGGSTHMEDLGLIESTVKWMLKEYKHVKFGLYCAKQMAEILMQKWDIDPDRVLFVPPRSFHDYPGGLANFDISLVPVVNCTFNAAKSNLKVIEFGAWGVPSFASKVAPYVRFIREGENGFFLDNRNALANLIENPKERERIGSNVKEEVQRDFDMDKLVHMWPNAWSNIYNRYMASTKGEKIERKHYSLWGRMQRNSPCPIHTKVKYKKCVCYPAWGR